MPVDEERERLRRICGEILSRGERDLFTVQLERVLCCITDGDCARIRCPEDVVKAFQRRGLVRGPVSALRPAPPETVLAFVFAACVYPRRVTKTELEVRLRCLLEIYKTLDNLTAVGIVARLRDLARLPGNAPDEQMLGLLSDLTAASRELSDWEERVTGAALFVATLSGAAIMGTPGGNGPRFGVLRNWLDDGEFLRFFRSPKMRGTPSSYFGKLVEDYGSPS